MPSRIVALLPKPRERGNFSMTEQEKAKRRCLVCLKNKSVALVAIGASTSRSVERDTVTKL